MSSINNQLGGRKLKFGLAINEALRQLMEADPSVFVIGQGVKSPWYVGNTCNGLIQEFGEARVIDTPISENAMSGVAAGAAMSGMKPVMNYPRLDFMFYALDAIINGAANWRYMAGGSSNVPVVFWGIINRGGEQAAQHSQAIQAIFAHAPGLKVVMPSNPYDAKGLLIAAVRDPDPVVFLDDRWVYGTEAEVPEELYEVAIGKGKILREGKDATIVAISYMVPQALEAAEILEKEGISVEVIDPRTIKPLDMPLILESVKKTGRLVIAEAAWQSFGVSSEISNRVYTEMFGKLLAPIEKVTLPDCPAPASRSLEEVYYPKSGQIVAAVKKLVSA
ncbi:MAG: pyruvate dehydrogenase complex E1 component subunit beta [Minisyncoccales bacterium]